jgi:hypothetical protein
MELEIEVLWHTDDTKALAKSGVDYDPNELERRTMTFYNIDAISPHIWDDNDFCNIHAGGDAWIAAYNYEEVKQMIAEARHKAMIDSHVELYKAAEFLIKEHKR